MSRNDHPEIHPDRGSTRGFLFGLAAYGLWGVLPIYFKAIATIGAVDIVAHRVIWSLPFLRLLLVFGHGREKVRAAFGTRKTVSILALTALLIGINWLLYVYAVTSGHILAASFGYYLNPLANVLLGRFVLKEHLSRLQWAAVAIAAAGISVLAAGALSQLAQPSSGMKAISAKTNATAPMISETTLNMVVLLASFGRLRHPWGADQRRHVETERNPDR